MTDYKIIKGFKYNKTGFDQVCANLKVGQVVTFSKDVSSLIKAGYIEKITNNTLENKDLKSTKKTK